LARRECLTKFGQLWAGLMVLLVCPVLAAADDRGHVMPDGLLQLKLRMRLESSQGNNRYDVVTHGEQWDAHKTAIIVCDMWDLHHCLN